MARIDAHHHLWKLGQFDYAWLDDATLAPLRRDFLPQDLQPLIDDVKIDQTIVVQTQHDLRENAWALRLAEQHAYIAGVVGWVDLASRDCEQQLCAVKDHAKFVGIRHVTQDEADDNFIVRRDVLDGLRVLEKHKVPFDLLFFEKHLHHAPTVATAVPNLPLVIDHLSKPRIKSGQTADWKDAIAAAARYPNVYCKLSGMITEADWTNWRPSDLQPYVDIALESFGPRRCMFGSDWPVCLLAGNYDQVHNALATCIQSLSRDEQAWIWGRTAETFYGLPSA